MLLTWIADSQIAAQEDRLLRQTAGLEELQERLNETLHKVGPYDHISYTAHGTIIALLRSKPRNRTRSRSSSKVGGPTERKNSLRECQKCLEQCLREE